MKRSKQETEIAFLEMLMGVKPGSVKQGAQISTEGKKLSKQELEDWLCEAVTACWRHEKIKNPEWFAKAHAYSQLYDLIQTLPE